ncbi:MAG: serine hydrolase domain-containing protein [Actinoallomurus sp.]
MTADRSTRLARITRFTRRDFGRFVGLASVVLPARPRPAHAGSRAWRVTGHGLPGLGDLEFTVMDFMEARAITCGSLAVTRNGRLLLARGYTWRAEPMPDTRPTSLFRTASVTKPITAAAVLRLIQEGRLQPGDRVTALLRLGTPADPRLADVTVLRLLQHLGGWSRGASGDPMFADPAIASALGRRLPITAEDIVRYVTARGLDRAPGTAYAYSNYGYLLLGKIIERVTGRPYADYVRTAVLAPLGIGRMRLSRTLVPAAGEVPYFSQYKAATVMDPSGAQVAAPYGTFNQENNAFNCGWLASAVDLARFARVFDGGTPVLSPASAARAFAVPETGASRNGRYYGCGWHVRPAGGGLITWHTGSLPGTYTLLVRRFDGLAWAVMFDQRDDPSGERYHDIDAALHEAADDVEAWPEGDLSALYFGKGAGR